MLRCHRPHYVYLLVVAVALVAPPVAEPGPGRVGGLCEAGKEGLQVLPGEAGETLV